MKEIVFLGDSYTWGQGLYYYKWISENRKFNKKINGGFSSHSEFITDDDLNFKDSLSFTNLVSTHLNLKCIKISSNGGSHQNNIAFYKGLPIKNNIKYVIFQLSSFARDMTDFALTNVDFNISYEERVKERAGEIVQSKLRDYFYQIYNYFLEQEKIHGFKTLYIQWLDDYSKYEIDRFIPIYIGDKLCGYDFNFMIEMQKYTFDFYLDDNHIYDRHLNKEGNLILANSIIRKIESL